MMATPTGSMAGPARSRRPRLSLQTKPIHHGPGARTRNSLASADPKSPTAFNTLSNVYVTAIERSTPTQSTPLTAIRLHQPLKLQTDPDTLRSHQQIIQTPSVALPDTPLSANATSPTRQMDIVYPSTMTPTPPLSAGPVESGYKIFTFPPMDANRQTVALPPTPTRRRVSFGGFSPVVKAPYSHNRSLHSILRNSPLRPSGMRSPSSPRRKSVRLQEKAARRVAYESPLTRTITTEKYTRSHIDLLVEEASPYTPSPLPDDSEIDLAMAYSGDETRDGGRTPGPFEEMRRRMTKLATETPVLSPKPDGIRKRKRKEKKRKWVWTIGKDDEENESGAIAALRVAAGEVSTPRATTTTAPELVLPGKDSTPEPLTAVEVSIETAEPELAPTTEADDDRMDIDTIETDGFHSNGATTPYHMDLEPEIQSTESSPAKMEHLGSTHSTELETGSRRDTPIPPDLIESSEKSYRA
ncbi:hypothetical protein O1611_g6343 [Lasiodiplodia mahajangana]|uniref:Uncharacterized protein n=1 Tax=Lasiodiplodia mahajangana TaxID=1108764 RepID=A0ACC2JIU9_9PEZI|nr:hypothetical protein O1611_g6343 [Lasiodiplodia mahajangana]